jgi:multidrug efflux system outer membrane protein
MPRGRPLVQQITLPAVPTGVPSALFERRPDIRQAEDQLAAATARIGVAKSDFYPRVFLTGAAAGGALHIDGSWIGPQGLFSIGPSIHLPIFNMGRTQAGVDSAEAQAQALAAGDAARLSNIRYKGGVTSYLEVLDSERQFFDAELGLVRSNRDELLAIVRLYKALGGGWQEEQATRAAESTGEREKK